MAAQMRLKHKSLFHTMTEAEFNEAVDKLDREIPQLNEDQIFVRLMQIVAMVQDGHSGFDTRPIPPPTDTRDHIPVRFVRYADGIYVRAASPEYADAVGGKMVAVGSHGWQDAIRLVDSVQSHDPSNDGEQLAWSAKVLLNWPLVLHGLGLSGSSESADFVIEKGGQRRTYSMKATAPVGEWYLNTIPEGWVDARPAGAPVPLSRQHEDKPYWFAALPKQHAVYFQFNLVLGIGGETIPEFSKRLATALDPPDVARLVIDLRNNTGGDNTQLRPLLVALIRSKLNRRGGIYAITGPTTFSAAQNFVNRMENYTETIFVGAPTAENVNFYGDPNGFTLPHSHLGVAVSGLWWQDKDPRDKRTATSPEVAAETTFQDYVAGKDPVLELALTMPTPQSIGGMLEAELSGGSDALLASYNGYVADPAHKYLPDPEAGVNTFGYKLLGERRFAEAILIFQLNTQTHPNSANAFDSLGEAYAAASDKPRSEKAYRRSKELAAKK